MGYYYISTDGGTIIESSSNLDDDTSLIRLNEQEWAIARMAYKGYLFREMTDALQKVYEIIRKARQ